jgi:hypothetical protein
MAKNLTRSSTGVRLSRASCKTRPVKLSQVSSRFRYHSGDVRSKDRPVSIAGASPEAGFVAPFPSAFVLARRCLLDLALADLTGRAAPGSTPLPALTGASLGSWLASAATCSVGSFVSLIFS